jgi:hypothetical protein
VEKAPQLGAETHIFSLAVHNSKLYGGTGPNGKLYNIATTIFDLPGKSTSSHKIYYNGILQTLTTDYVILTGGGDGDADRVEFTNPPAAGAVITAEFAGYLRIRARFDEDKLNRQMFYALLYTTGISLKGLKAT